MIRRKLFAGVLPSHSVPIIVGRPGEGGSCDVCGQPLLTTHLVMEAPAGESFVHLHADCFMLWNEVRSPGRSLRGVAP